MTVATPVKKKTKETKAVQAIVKSIDLTKDNVNLVTVSVGDKLVKIKSIDSGIVGLSEGMVVNLNADQTSYSYKLEGETKNRNSPMNYTAPICNY